jgi:hypothetical protein
MACSTWLWASLGDFHEVAVRAALDEAILTFYFAWDDLRGSQLDAGDRGSRLTHRTRQRRLAKARRTGTARTK